MILCHRHKFIFLKTNKTAGTSIEIALSKHCGPDDVITPISRGDEQTRKQLGYPGPQNYMAPIWDYGPRDVVKALIKRQRKTKYYHHMPAVEIRARVGEKVWNEYFKFCFERNPFDRIVSHYFYSFKSEPRPSISEFIQSDKPLMLKKRGYELYSIDGKIAVDKVYRFENLAEDLETFRLKVGIPEKLQLPNAKAQFRKDKRGYREILSQPDQELIAERFRDEIEHFGYEF